MGGLPRGHPVGRPVVISAPVLVVVVVMLVLPLLRVRPELQDSNSASEHQTQGFEVCRRETEPCYLRFCLSLCKPSSMAVLLAKQP
jgi:hypothetical protein